eukprot:SAG22_NODE_73_length_22318_cov_47.105315_13_plen_167_part_00
MSFQRALLPLAALAATAHLGGLCGARAAVPVDHAVELTHEDFEEHPYHDSDWVEDHRLQSEMVEFYCKKRRLNHNPICEKIDREREMEQSRDDPAGHRLPVEHLDEEEDDELHRIYCAKGAPGSLGHPKLCSEYEERKTKRIYGAKMSAQVGGGGRQGWGGGGAAP